MTRQAMLDLIDEIDRLGLRQIVAGWNGEGLEDGPNDPHHPELRVTLPTNAGTVYAIDAAVERARLALAGDDEKRLKDTIRQAAAWFQEYEASHRAKNADDKAERNRQRAATLLAALLPDFGRAADYEWCMTGTDGDCNWRHCPQHRDNEPAATGRSCPKKWPER